MTILPESPLPPKPRFGTPCNHCGLCCHLSLCRVAEDCFPSWEAPCPALTILDGKALCGLVMMERATGVDPVIQKILGVGAGCTMEDEDTPLADVLEFNRINQVDFATP